MFSYHDDGCPEIDEYDREHDEHRSQDAEQRQHQIEPEREVLLPERERDPTRVVRQTLCGELVADLSNPLQKTTSCYYGESILYIYMCTHDNE